MRSLVTAHYLLLMLAARADYAPYQGSSNIEASAAGLVAKHFHDWAKPPAFNILDSPDSPFSDANHAAYVELWDQNNGKRLWRKPSPALSSVWVSPDGEFVVGLSEIAWSNPYQLVIYSRSGDLLKAEHISTLVARFSKKELDEFWIAYPKLKTGLERFTTKFGEEYYVDFSFVGREQYPEARRVLYARKTINPNYPGARGSISNWIWWYDSETKPLVRIEDGLTYLILKGYSADDEGINNPNEIRIQIPNKADIVTPSKQDD